MELEKEAAVLESIRLVSREYKPEDTVVTVGNVKIGGGHRAYIAGPCSVEDEGQILEIAELISDCAHILRGGAFKPRTSPYSFQGLGEEGLRLLVKAGSSFGLPVVTEVLSEAEVELAAAHVDMLQIGARNMQNYALLKKVGAQSKPVLLKRGFAATMEELLLSAEYILAAGNSQVVLCERGIRTFSGSLTRFTLDLSAVPILKQLTHLPVIVDPSHGTGRWNLVEPLAKAALAVGADGVMVEVHSHPQEALSDGPQSLKPDKFRALAAELNALAQFLDGRSGGI
ncbi:MAG: 3-deoxy-7-phosphoheptulonate synthase [Firmicutes bacterium]|jgi:3-deoxy-7-phosphoheptulonate synthase|nr:3-deoxy-7-phosphoheptulonate synthase [Bacillota bacterium]NLL08665.1 3-deoxy-7-phosphoheptulonate synthase [Bacillota bacterium]HBG10071.1 3-deoxy-7-phosphoheptulonate synthase [Bacillota bacterium]